MTDRRPAADNRSPLSPDLQAAYRDLISGDSRLDPHTDRALTQPGMRVETRPLTDGAFPYYGTRFAVDTATIPDYDPQKPYVLTEREIGVLGIYGGGGSPIGVVNVHPDRVNYKNPTPVRIISPVDLFQNILLRNPPHFQEDWQAFLRKAENQIRREYSYFTDTCLSNKIHIIVLFYPSMWYAVNAGMEDGGALWFKKMKESLDDARRFFYGNYVS